RLKCAPVVKALEFAGAENARTTPQIEAALSDPDLRAVIICPSNPLISIDPILAVPGMRSAIVNCKAPVVAISPIVAGKALKGPTAKMLDELGIGATAAIVADRYRDLLTAYVVEADDYDDCLQAGFPFAIEAAHTIMTSLEDREALARTVLATADRNRSGKSRTERAAG
ncbi:MAG: 2-phospho-L-lactate transferase CofD family protein, partial [Pseudomonadota bacterium]